MNPYGGSSTTLPVDLHVLAVGLGAWDAQHEHLEANLRCGGAEVEDGVNG